MKLVASAKLHKAQTAIEGMLPYNGKLTEILNKLLNDPQRITSPYMNERPVRRVAIVAMSSDTSLCGAFNNNVIKLTGQVIQEYLAMSGNIGIALFPIGRKMSQAFVTNESIVLQQDYADIGDTPQHSQAAALSAKLCEMFIKGEIDKVELVYTHYKNMTVQVLMRKTFLPIEIHQTEQDLTAKETTSDYIIEPSLTELADELIPQALAMQIYAALLDSNAAEHAARTFAMQQATDNAETLLHELNLSYNKGRQQAITNELLDIIGGTMK